MAGNDPSINTQKRVSYNAQNAPRERGATAERTETPAGRGVVDALRRLSSKVFRSIYRQEKYLIFSSDIEHRKLPTIVPVGDIEIRLLEPRDAALFREFWRPAERSVKMARFKHRMRNGYIGVGAWSGGRLVGVNWTTGGNDHDSLTGLWFRMAPDACYALDLHEHKDFDRRKVGLSVLAFSIREAQRRGFKRHYIAMNDQNRRMLAGAVFFLGYRKAGEITTTYIFRRPHSRWTVGGRPGRGRTVLLGVGPAEPGGDPPRAPRD